MFNALYPHQSAFFHLAPEYKYQCAIVNGRKVGSDLNLHNLFVERCFRLLHDGGQCGIVIPSGIYTDLGAKGLRQLLFECGKLHNLRSFSNEKLIFEDVHHAFKFCLMIFERGGQTSSFLSSFRMHTSVAIRPEELGDFLEDPFSTLEISKSLVHRLSPGSCSVIELSTHTDLEITNRMFNYPLLGERIDGRWNLRLAAEFHMTNDSNLFLIKQTDAGCPLYEGKTDSSVYT